MIQQHKKRAKFLRTNETFCPGSGLKLYFGTLAGVPLVHPVLFFFVCVCVFPQVREFSAAPHQRSRYSRLRVVKQWKVTGYLNQRIILAPDKSLRRVQLQDKHTDVCQSAPHQPPPPPSAYDTNSQPASTFDFHFFFHSNKKDNETQSS